MTPTQIEKAGLNMALIAFKTVKEMLENGMKRSDIQALVDHNIRALDELVHAVDGDIN